MKLNPKPGDVLWHRANDEAPDARLDVPYLIVEVVVTPGGYMTTSEGYDRSSPDHVAVRLMSLETGDTVWLDDSSLRALARQCVLYKT